MKFKTITFGMAVASMFSMPVLANMGASVQEMPVLERGVSPTQILANGHPKRFQIKIDQPTTLRVSSEHFAGVSSQGNQIKAILYDDAGNRVAEASSPRGHFQLNRQLQPGSYQIEVSGSSLGGNAESDRNRYELHAAY